MAIDILVRRCCAATAWLAMVCATVAPSLLRAQEPPAGTTPNATASTPEPKPPPMVPVIATGDQRLLKRDHTGWPVGLAFSPDGKELARLQTFGHSLLDTASFTHIRRFDVGIRMLAYSRDGKTMATAEGTDGARVWNASERGTPEAAASPFELRKLSKPLHVLLTQAQSHNEPVLAVAFAPDGRSLATADAAGHLKIWNTKTGKVIAEVPKASAALPCVAFDPKGTSIAFGDADGVLHLWDVAGKRMIKDVTTPAGTITSVSFSKDGRRIATTHDGRQGKATMIWDSATFKAQVEPGLGVAAFSPDGTTLALGFRDVQLLAPLTGEHVRTISFPEFTHRELWIDAESDDSDKKMPVIITSLAWRPDGRELAVGCLDGSVRLVPIH